MTFTITATDPDGDDLTAILIRDVRHGGLVLTPSGSFNYTPAPEFSGEDSFLYRVSDGEFNSNVARVRLIVGPVNDAPNANDDRYRVNEDNSLTVTLPSVLSNDTDIDNDTLTSHGTLDLSNDGTFTYTPDQDFNGEDSFTYTADDGELESNVAEAKITVNPMNDPPVAVAGLAGHGDLS